VRLVQPAQRAVGDLDGPHGPARRFHRNGIFRVLRRGRCRESLFNEINKKCKL
jgi:hypothetical protein